MNHSVTSPVTYFTVNQSERKDRLGAFKKGEVKSLSERKMKLR
jgi:hypothetical protein